MNQKLIHKRSEASQIKVLRAKQIVTQAFSSGKILFQLLFFILLGLSPLLFTAEKVESQKAIEHSLGEQHTTNIFPTAVVTNDWAAVDNVLTQDLDDHALYQDFSARNSSYVPQTELFISDDPTNQQEASVDLQTGESEPEVPSVDGQENESDDTAPPDESVSQEIVPVSWSFPNNLQLIETLKISSRSYPLAQLTITSTTDATASSPQEAIVIKDEESIDAPQAQAEAEVIGDEPSSNTVEIHEITLENFDTASLEPGHFVEGMQLRLSFAAKLETAAAGTSPYIDVLFGTDDSMQSAGIILLDEEVSNAINGGYYLFALPSFIPVEELKNAKVTLRYHGNNEDVEGMFLDAAWLEMSTRIITKEDLRVRGLAEQLVHLGTPDISVLLSDQLNFDRTQTPIFNLRYESQQNFLVRNFLKLIGRNSLNVSSVVFSHETIGESQVEPEVNITKEGLVTIEVPEDDLKEMRPGTYEVIITYDENGFEYIDTFNFQWGILTINPNKSEYEVSEVAKISMGALSTNGNTLCDASLDLYITSPAGFVTKAPVTQSGLCNGNNVIDVPDFSAEFPVAEAGEYELYLERLDEDGNVIGFTTDTFKVVTEQSYGIERVGPTRIYPKAAYPMELTVTTADTFDGVLRERVPAAFVISSTSAEITQDGDWQILSWNIGISGAGTETVSYGFDAPDISPYLYNLGAASLEGDVSVTREVTKEVQVENASSTDGAVSTATSSVTEQVTSIENGLVFKEHRQWQIASDAVGSMQLMWDGPTIPTGWTCVSCTAGDVFFQRFIMGSSTAGINGGAATHTHTATAAVLTTTVTTVMGAGGAANYASVGHSHTLAPVIGTANNLPSYRNLVIIQNNSAGEPISIPAGAITIFDAAVPSGWTQYSAQNGFYVRGESIANRTLTGGSNTHTHTITGTTGVGSGSDTGAGGALSISNNVHTHTISSNTAPGNSEPPHIQMIIGKLTATSTMPNGSITMWSEDAPTDWNVVSGASGILSSRVFKPSATFGTTGGSTTETPANVNGITSAGGNGPSPATRGGTGTTRPAAAHTHQVNVTGFSTANILPPFRSAVFAKRAGGQPPAAPVIQKLFDQEKTGTSTPAFEFTANDPVGTDTLVYQFQWDTDPDLDTARIGDRTSDNEAGCSPNCFTNTVTGGDTNPFNEAERIRFRIPDPLTSGTTYYYRVRAKKSAGTTWSAWSTVNTFTYVVDTDPSQWLQTTDTQFNTGVYSNAETFGSDSVRIANAQLDEVLVAYGEGTVTTPRYRIWDGTVWSAEASAQDISGVVQWVKTAAGTTRNEYILGVQDDVSDVNVQIFNGVTNTWGNLTEVTAAIPDNTRRGFDVAYETTSGDAIVVYCDATNAAYRIWNGTSWSAQVSITTASTNNCNYIALASDPLSDEIILVTRDNSAGVTDYEALVWNGSAWGNSITGGVMVDLNNEGTAVEYEESGGQAIVTFSNGLNNSFLWSTWNGTEWSTLVAQALGGDFQWGTLKADSGSDNMALCYIDTDDDLGIVRWNGETWATVQEFDGNGNPDTGRSVSCEFETIPGRDGNIMIPYSDTTNARWRAWNGAAFSGEATISTILDSWEVGSVRAADGKILTVWHDDDTNTQYDFSFWNGTIWSTIQTLEGSPSVTANPRRSPIDMSARISQFVQGSVTSDPVNFGLVTGRPTWGEALWSTSEPAGTSVKVQVLFATTSACNVLVPDGVIPGNSVGFAAGASPINLASLSTTTYANLCLRATLTSQSQNIPTLDDWTLSWERQPFLTQSQYRWYANRNLETPNDVWPVGGIDILQNEPIAQAYSPGSGDILRLRMAVRSDNAPLGAGSQAFKLQYSQSSGLCASSTVWADLGGISSSTAKWRGHNNLFAFDGSSISSLLLTGADVGGTYEEENNSSVNPNTIAIGNEGEWDWVIEHNGADDGVQYCFRMVTSSGVELSSYQQIPSLVTNASPEAPALEKLFDNEQVASTSPWFEFASVDPEGEDVSYQIQVDDSFDFSSVALDRNSTTHLSEFENIVTPADKDAFTMGQTIRFKPASALSNNTTYYWRVRARDGDGSNDWGVWSTVSSFTVNTATGVTTWSQTQSEQFNTNENSNTEATGSNDVILTTPFTVGTTTSTVLDFDKKTTGNAWGSLSWNNNLTTGSIRYTVEYLDNGLWVRVPNTFLPGNSAGFNSSPVSLLGLDPKVHNEIRVRAVLTSGGGSPRLLDWKIEWGFAVEQPTQRSLFDNEKTGTTTPTFSFSTIDPESNDIQYQFSWSTDSTFVSASSSALSGVNLGFVNLTTGADTSPFISGNTISYRIQSALINGTTYYWRVRGRDPAGGNAWSVWSPVRSFTVDTTVGISTWFQTTDPQFKTDELNDTETNGSGGARIASLIREAMFSYAEGTIQTPRYRLWNGSSWSAEASGVSVGGVIRFVESAATQVRNEYTVVTQEAGGRVRAQIYNGANDTFGNLQTIIAAVPSTVARGYDVAYETSSGDAMVVACTGTEATYSVWNGSSWSGATALPLAVTANCNWIELASDPTSDEIMLVVRDAATGATDFQALVWNGSAWGNSMTLGSVSEVNNEGIAIEYEESGAQAVVVVSNGGNASFSWNSWNGTAWSGVGTQPLADDFENGRLGRDAGTDNMALCSIDNNGQIALVRWTGSTNTWNAFQTVELTGNSKNGKPMDCVFETTAGRDGNIMIPYSDITDARYQFWNGTTLSAETTISTIQDSQEVRAIRTGDDNILALFYDDANTQYDFSFWNGTVWSTIQTLETTSITTTAPPTIPFSVVARRFPTFTEGNVVSSPIDFDEGSGLKWKDISFNNTTPGASDILYQVEYLNGDTWQLIPNGALAGNSTGFTNSPIDISNVSRVTYNTIRLKANLTCVSGNCPVLNDWTVTWSEGINVSGTVKQYNQTASTTAGTVAVAVNGVLQAGKTATVVNGAWSIANVSALMGDIVTVFMSGAADSAEAVAVTRYDGDGDISGLNMFERHLVLGSNDATTTPMTNTNIGSYDFTNTEDIFFNGNGSTLSMCATTGCADARLYVRSNVRYTPGGRFVTHDFQNFGFFTAGAFTHEVNGSWDNNATSTMTGSTVVFAATSTTESIDSVGAPVAAFNNVTFGTTTGNASWTLSGTLDVDGALTVARGTLARANTPITVAGNLTNGTNGNWTGRGTTTFDGSTASTWRDQNAVLQNIGRVVIDGASKAVTLAGNVASQSITIGANDTLDASVSNYDITVFDSWRNQNNFVARLGEVFFAATSTGKVITTTGDPFYDLTFSGAGGGWSFTESTVFVGNDFRSTAGTVTLPTATTSVAGSFTMAGGTYGNNNGTLLFTSASPETITFAGGPFTNVAHNMWFNGTGDWTVTDTNATSTNDIRVQQGTLNFPSGVFAIGGSLADIGGAYNGGTGTIKFYSATTESLTAGGSAFNNVLFAGAGAWSFTDANVTTNRNVTINQGTLTLPSGIFAIAGSYDNNATVTPGTGTVRFDSTDSGETIDFGSSPLYNVLVSNAGGGFTMTASATTTNNFTLTSANNFTLSPGRTLAVGGVFTNSIGGAPTTWTGSTVALYAGDYSLNTKANAGDAYDTLAVRANTNIAMWNSSATTYTVNGTGSLYSQDHNAIDGDLYIWGAYENNSGSEHWSFATDFDGTALGGSSRQVDVRFASGASASFASSTLTLLGGAAATTTINGQTGSSYYGVRLAQSTINARYYQFDQLNATGLVLDNGTIINSLRNGVFTLSTPGGTSITLATTTIDANPAQQIYDVTFNSTFDAGAAGGNGSDTFLFFDDFADGSINSAKWTKDIELGAITETGGYLRAGGGTNSGNYGHTSLGSEVGYASFLNNAVMWRGRNSADGIGEMVFRGDFGTNRGYKARFDARTGQGQSMLEVPYSGWTFANGTGTCTSDSDVPAANTWYTYQVTASSSNYKFYRNAVLKRDCTDSTTLVAGEIALQNHFGSYTDFDWVAVRKFVNPEPAHSSWGAEEEPQTGTFRKSHVINGTAAGAQTDYVLPVTVNFGSGADSGQTMFCNSKCKGDFSDVKFTDSSGSPLSFWREESYVASSTATFWVKLNSIPVSPGTTSMYLYYGVTSGFNVTVPGVTEAISSVWFRNHRGNLDGEAFDKDLGTNAGDVRWDDSPISLTISGTVYSDAGVTPLTGGTCNGSAQSVRVVVNGGTSYTGSCSAVNGSYSISGVSVIGDPTITIYLDNASGGQRGSIITRTPTGNITNADIYANRIILRHEDTDVLSIANLAIYDTDNDSDMRFIANGGTLRTLAGSELYVWKRKTFTPNGAVTLSGNAGTNSFDGTLTIDNGATFNAHSTTTLSIAGRLVLGSQSIFNAASTTVLMNATSSGKSITSTSSVNFNNVTFNGVNGTWNLGANITAQGNMQVTNGIVTGTGNITLPNGSLTGNGVLSLGAGTTTIARTNTLGGTSAWTFANLQLGNGIALGTTTPVFISTTTVSGRLTIAAAHFLAAGATKWDLSGAGTVFRENGTFLEDTSTIRYSGGGSNVLSTRYYNLDINAGIGTQTYAATGLGIIVDNLLSIGGSANTTFNLTTADPALDVNGSVLIRSNGTFQASDTGVFTIAGNYTNNGTFIGNNGTVRFDATGNSNIAAGNSSFSNVSIAGTGTFFVTQNATSTGSWRLSNAGTFELASGRVLAVQGTFINAINGSATTWTGSTLRLSGNGNYSINNATTTDNYATFSVSGTTQIRMWNSDATSYNIANTASLYSQDHANQNGNLSIWGAYRKTSGTDHWSHATDFDGAALGSSTRKVNVSIASGASISVTGGGLAVYGSPTASTTIQNQGSGSYSMLIGGNSSSSLRYYEVKNINASGLVLTGTPAIGTLSNGNLEVSQNGGTALTVGATVITANPARNFTRNRFALNGVASGFNVTATGTTLSAWRFANHYGDIDGEALDVDPGGDPGYIAWDDSAALITVSGNVYSDEGTTVSGACDGVSNNITLRVAGITSYSTPCNATTGAYSVGGVSYGIGDSLVVYIDGEPEKGAHVTKEPISNISNLHIYENRVIVRHENTTPISIADMAIWDSSDDADIPFTAIDGTPDTLTLPANRKLIVWSGKNFAPNGNVTISGGGAGAVHDGTLQLQTGADWTGQGTELLSVGGSMILDTGADFVSGNGTTTFTTTGSARTIDLNEDSLFHAAFTGSGSWTVTDPTFNAQGNLRITAGALTLPTGTSTFNGSFVNTGGSFNANSGTANFTGTGARMLTVGASSLATVLFNGGNYSFTDINATTTASVTIRSGTITLPSGVFSLGGNFRNLSGGLAHNTSLLAFRNPTAATLLASSSDLFAASFTGGGAYTVSDRNITFLDDIAIINGSSLALASGTVAVGGGLNATAGTFTGATTTFLFNSSDVGETIHPGVSSFYGVQISAPTGGYTFTGSATTTRNFIITSAQNFTVQSGATIKVGGVFQNSVGGTNTTWNGSTLALNGSNAYSINTKSAGADRYNRLLVGANSDIRMWNSSATTTSINTTSSLYSQDHNATNGALSIYGDFHIGTTTEYWSYVTDFDGASLIGAERPVTVAHASNATTTVDGGVLAIQGVSGNETTITNQGSGTFAMRVTAGTLNALHYRLRNLNISGLNLSGTPIITSLSNGDFELAVNNGSLITVAASTLSANASLVITGNRFATTSAITGKNVTLSGTTGSAWTFVTHTGNLDGELYDVDGATLCGSVRWSDSSCLITQQTNYRWRNDNGNIGVPSSEWYNASWDARKSVRVDNPDTNTYTNPVVRLYVSYDSDMKSDFSDLRFTQADGVTLIPHWIGSSTDSVGAEVWLRIPSLPAQNTATAFMYYYNPTASNSSSAEDTFIAADDFEDGDLSEYSGQTGLFTVDGTFAHDGAFGLDNTGDESARANLGGIFRFDQTINQGETIRYKQYVNTSAGSGDETCALFAVQSPGTLKDNYAVCIEQFGTDRISLARDVQDNDTSGTILASSTVTYATGWYEVEIDWRTDDSMLVSLYNDSGSLVTSISATDSSYSSGGFGFTYWFHNGGWDSFGTRPTLTTEPSIRFGAEQGDGGASWKVAQNVTTSYDVGDVARLRIAIENTGTIITGQQFLLEYAALGNAPSCESVSAGSFVTVPTQSTCGTSPVCMTSSSLVTNGAATGDLLFNTLGLFTAGQFRENPSNITSAFSIDQNQYTELEYALTPTVNTVDENLCFRVTNNGADLDTYLRVPRLTLQFTPTVTGISLNGGADITLLPGATTTIYATGTATDLNGASDLRQATSTFYRSGAVGGAACSVNNNNCYRTSGTQCRFTACAGDSCTVECRADVYFHADATDTGSAFPGEEWFAFVEVEDTIRRYNFASSLGVELSTLRAIDVNGAINYGAIEVLGNTGSNNASTTIQNEGNIAVNIEVEGTDMADGASSRIPANQQKFATSTFNYSGCGISCNLLSSTTPYELDVELAKPTVSTPPVSDEVYWGIAVPFGVNSTPHQGINVFTPVSP